EGRRREGARGGLRRLRHEAVRRGDAPGPHRRLAPVRTRRPLVKRPTILVVEDNKITRRMFRVALESQGWDVVEAHDGKSAIQEMSRARPDLVVQDLTLPDVEGFDLLRRLSEPGG